MTKSEELITIPAAEAEILRKITLEIERLRDRRCDASEAVSVVVKALQGIVESPRSREAFGRLIAAIDKQRK